MVSAGFEYSVPEFTRLLTEFGVDKEEALAIFGSGLKENLLTEEYADRIRVICKWLNILPNKDSATNFNSERVSEN